MKIAAVLCVVPPIYIYITAFIAGNHGPHLSTACDAVSQPFLDI